MKQTFLGLLRRSKRDRSQLEQKGASVFLRTFSNGDLDASTLAVMKILSRVDGRRSEQMG
eukprot:322624-Pleurochrysis_carterae.AAC.2